MRRLQMELPFLCTAAANDAKPARVDGKPPNKRGAKKPTPHARPKLPAHLPRVPNVLLVPEAQQRCPRCDIEVERVCIKTTAEKLDIRPLGRRERTDCIAKRSSMLLRGHCRHAYAKETGASFSTTFVRTSFGRAFLKPYTDTGASRSARISAISAQRCVRLPASTLTVIGAANGNATLFPSGKNRWA
jgi:hypothetical protein